MLLSAARVVTHLGDPLGITVASAADGRRAPRDGPAPDGPVRRGRPARGPRAVHRAQGGRRPGPAGVRRAGRLRVRAELPLRPRARRLRLLAEHRGGGRALLRPPAGLARPSRSCRAARRRQPGAARRALPVGRARGAGPRARLDGRVHLAVLGLARRGARRRGAVRAGARARAASRERRRDPAEDLRRIAFCLERALEPSYRVKAFRTAAAVVDRTPARGAGRPRGGGDARRAVGHRQGDRARRHRVAARRGAGLPAPGRDPRRHAGRRGRRAAARRPARRLPRALRLERRRLPDRGDGPSRRGGSATTTSCSPTTRRGSPSPAACHRTGCASSSTWSPRSTSTWRRSASSPASSATSTRTAPSTRSPRCSPGSTSSWPACTASCGCRARR